MKNRLASLSLTEIVFFLLSLCYLVAEFVFNVTLLDVAGSVRAEPRDIERVADFGRTVSACGFTLLVLGFFARYRFRLDKPYLLGGFYAFAALCLLPFFLSHSAMDIMYAAPVLFGVFLMTVSRGRFPFHSILALTLVAGPAMYSGQRILIESLIIHPTTWEQRADARNLLLLRSGLEDCIVELEGLWLCEGDKASAEVRAVRAMITALWMHSPVPVVQSLAPAKQRIMENALLKGSWFNPREQYKKYVAVVENKRGDLEKQILDEYYAPYKKASDAYEAALAPEKSEKEIIRIWEDMERRTNAAWDEYQRAARVYRQQLYTLDNTVLSRMAPAFERMDEFCGSRNCPRGNADRAALRLQDEVETRFIRETGLPPDVRTKEDFMLYPRVREEFEAQFTKKFKERTGISGAALPPDWQYDEAYMKSFLRGTMQQKIVLEWKRKFGSLKPGLTAQELFDYYQLPPLPDLDKIVMSEADFTQKQALPRGREMVAEVYRSMLAEGPLYGNGESMEHKGKDYIRAVYVPSIALLLSLVIVLVTLVRGVNGGLKLALRGRKSVGKYSPRQVRLAAVAGFVALIFALPYAVPNSFTSSPVYKGYVAQARAQNMLTAGLLDWAIHMQPVIYSAVHVLRK